MIFAYMVYSHFFSLVLLLGPFESPEPSAFSTILTFQEYHHS